MQLIYSPTSPYARKVRALIVEKGLTDRVRQIPENPFAEAPHVAAHNPLGKVPVLIRDDGPTLVDSRVICEYLDWIDDDPRLHSRDRETHWAIARHAAFADGILDAAVEIVTEGRRAPEMQWAYWIDRYRGAIERTLDALEREPVPPEGSPTMATIGLAVALGYLDFRLPDLDWRTGHPNLAEFEAEVAQRPSLADTRPPSG